MTDPLSAAQRRLWFLHRADPADTAFHVPLAFRLRGRLDETVLAGAVAAVVERHAVLRTLLSDLGQQVLPVGDPRCPVLRRHPDGTDVAELARTPFDLTAEVPFQAHLVRSGPDEHVLLLLLHHVATDGQSDTILLRDLAEAHRLGRLDRPAPAVTYAEYAAWQRELLGEQDAPTAYSDRMLEHWRTVLDGMPHEIDIPRDAVAPDAVDDRHDTWFEVPGPDWAALSELARRERATPYMLVHAVVAAVLSRIGAGQDLPLGTVVAGRHDEALEEVVGFFNNPLLIRTRVDVAQPFTGLLDEVRQAALTAYANQEIPFDWIVSAVNPARGSRHPLFQLSVEYHRADDGVPGLPGLEVTPVRMPLSGAKLDLSWDFSERPGTGPVLQLSYDNTAYDRDFVLRLGRWTVEALGVVARDPGVRVGHLPLSGDDFDGLPHRAAHPDIDAGLVRRVREVAAGQPDSAAIVTDDEAVTYAGLVARASHLAARLRAAGAGRGTIVPSLAVRGAEVVTALLAIREVGGVYLPLDPAAPVRRNRELLEQTGAGLLLTVPATRETGLELAAAAGLPEPLTIGRDGGAPGANEERADDTAYVIFTSGSTGRPKGALVRADGMINNMLGEAEALSITGPELMASTAPLTFDISVWQTMTPLLFGGTVRPVPDDVARAPMALFDLAARERWTMLQVVPSLLDAALDDWEAGHPLPQLALRRLAVTGEALPPSTCRRWAERYPDIPLVNMYGPTECSDDVAHAVIRSEDPVHGPRTPIGRATRGSRLYVLDETLRPALLGVPGELYVGGVVVGKGYLGDPRRTATTFVADPFDPRQGSRMYRTGDVVRRRSDGQLEFCGRSDHQVKIRGRRIELGEIEHALRSIPGVNAAAVVVAPVAGSPSLAAYWTGPATAGEVRGALAGELPAALIPSSLMPLPALPLTPNGKLDRAALPAPAPGSSAGREPRNDRERALCDAFAEVLALPEVGPEDDFFDLGGHSLLVLRLIRAIQQRTGVDLTPAVVFAAPTPALLAAGAGVSVRDVLPGMRRDAVLPADIDPSGARPAGPGGDILLTGPTGFLGAFLLRRLLDTSDARIYCLVRAESDEAAAARLRSAMAEFALLDDGMERVVARAGDLARPQFGLAPQRYDQLAAEVGTIVHNGATVSFLRDYAALRSANVEGTVEVLRLAAAVRVKSVHYVSTIDTLVPASPGKTVTEHTRTPAELVGFGGYERTKWVAERLVEAAGARGVPVAIHRPGRISGSTETGAGPRNDAFWQFVQACIHIGVAPKDGPVPADALIPVNDVAAAIVHLALAAVPAGECYHLVGTAPTSLGQVLDRARRLGHRIDEVPFGEWRNRIRDAAGPDGPVKAVSWYLETAGDDEVTVAHSHDCSATSAVLAEAGLTPTPVGDELLDAYLIRLARAGQLTGDGSA
ncbi:amino acid adenylation domain-containing protein [Micromonospora sp. HNM0581]|nr:amino acid adenylation domain-containing protein [Micromonospora sp. HNM0581]